MRRAARFLLVLLAGLAVLTLVGYFALSRTIRGWFESDLAMRSQLAVAAARRGLADTWQGDPERLTETLIDIANDERILGAAACSPNGTLPAPNRRQMMRQPQFLRDPDADDKRIERRLAKTV